MHSTVNRHVTQVRAAPINWRQHLWHGTSLSATVGRRVETDINIMKKLLIVATLAGTLGVQNCFAFAVNATRTIGYYADGGGEFTVTDAPDPIFESIYQNYAAVATLNGGFQTFCISTTTGVKNNGNSLDASLDPSGIAVGTAWLYTMFAKGTLPFYNYSDTSPGGGRSVSAVELQNAIWELQGQHFDPELAALYIGIAIEQFGSLEAASATAVGSVDGLRMTFNGDPSQPMLALVPDGGVTLMLLGLGLSSLGAFSRRFRS